MLKLGDLFTPFTQIWKIRYRIESMKKAKFRFGFGTARHPHDCSHAITYHLTSSKKR
jgi:hypothetical protein